MNIRQSISGVYLLDRIAVVGLLARVAPEFPAHEVRLPAEVDVAVLEAHGRVAEHVAQHHLRLALLVSTG